jgi:hypothetical protein
MRQGAGQIHLRMRRERGQIHLRMNKFDTLPPLPDANEWVTSMPPSGNQIRRRGMDYGGLRGLLKHAPTLGKGLAARVHLGPPRKKLSMMIQ